MPAIGRATTGPCGDVVARDGRNGVGRLGERARAGRVAPCAVRRSAAFRGQARRSRATGMLRVHYSRNMTDTHAAFALYVATLGRGPGRSRALTREEARAAFGMVLRG